nr:T9SS type A sorting domain-containing protein [uncultured Carboxylicivirga sp.]
MKSNSTSFKTLKKITIIFLLTLVMASCYVIRVIYQPKTVEPNSTFDVTLVVEMQDGQTVNEPDKLARIGILIPDGWTVQEPITAYKVAKEGTTGTNDEGTIRYSQAQVDGIEALDEGAYAAPEGYHWWGGVSDANMNFAELDSAYLTATIVTDDKVGDFQLRYVIGDGDSKIIGDNGDGGFYDITVSNTPTGVKKDQIGKVKLYPNPVKDQLSVELSDFSADATIQILNSVGATVMKSQSVSQINQFDLSALTNGMYFVVVESNGNKKCEKILLQK